MRNENRSVLFGFVAIVARFFEVFVFFFVMLRIHSKMRTASREIRFLNRGLFSSIDHSFFPNTNFDKLSLTATLSHKKNDAIERERFRSTSSSFLSSEKMISYSSSRIETEDDDVQGWGKPYQQEKGPLSQNFFVINSTRRTLLCASLRCYVLLHTLVCLNCAFAEANCVVVDETANMVSI